MQVQTEGTNLAVVKEASLGARTPPASGWRNLEPNSYGNYGASYKKVPRDPISKAQQLQKGMLTDEDSGLPFECDITKDVIDRFAEGIFRCAPTHAGSTGTSSFAPTAVTATGYTVPALGGLDQHFLVVARGFENDENNGLKEVGAGSTDTEVKVPGLVVEADPPANVELEIAGWRGATGDIQFDADNNLISTLADFTSFGLEEQQFIYVGGEAAANQFATAEFLGSAQVTKIEAHKLTLDRRSWEIEKKAELDLGSLATQLDTVVRAKTAGPAGNSITVAAVADGAAAVKSELDLATVTAHVDTVIRAKTAGADGDDITIEFVAGAATAAGVLTEVGTHVKIEFKATATASTVADIEALIATSTLIEVKTAGTGATSLDGTDAFGSEALAGGSDADAPSVAEVGDAVTLHYTSGATTVAELEAVITSTSTKIEVKTEGTAAAVLLVGDDDFAATNLAGGNDGSDDGAGKNIDVYFTRFYRSVDNDHPDYSTPSYAFEMTYPTLGDAGEPEYEYMLGNEVDEWVWNIPLTSKATVNASFVGLRTLPITGTRKSGPADALDPVSIAGVSTSTDIARLRISDTDDLGIATDFQSIKITMKNMVSPQKQVGQLGGRLMNRGKHTCTVEASVIFTTSDVIDAVRDNRECRLDVLLRNPDFGAMIDVQSMTLDAADKKLEKDKSVTVDSKGTGFQNGLSGSTDGLSVFAYLPPIPDDDE